MDIKRTCISRHLVLIPFSSLRRIPAPTDIERMQGTVMKLAKHRILPWMRERIHPVGWYKERELVLTFTMRPDFCVSQRSVKKERIVSQGNIPRRMLTSNIIINVDFVFQYHYT